MSVVKIYSVYIMALLYIVAGILHFSHTNIYEKIVPDWLPSPQFWVYITGILEILLGLLLFPKLTRRQAAWGIIILLILVFPANIQMLLNYIEKNHSHTWIAWVRLPMQVLLIWWAFVYTRIANNSTDHTS